MKKSLTVVTVMMLVMATGCQTTQQACLALPQRQVTVSLLDHSYRQGDYATYSIDYGSTMPFGNPTVEILSGTQVVLTEQVPQLHAVVRRVYRYGIRLLAGDKPLPPGEYSLRVCFADQQTETLPFRIK